MFDWFKKSKKQARIVTNVHDLKEQSSVKVQNVSHSTAENIVAAEQISNSFNQVQGDMVGTKIINYYSETTKQQIQVLVNTHHLPEPTTALIGR